MDLTPPENVARRKLLVGAATTAAVWSTPSVMGFDRVGAAVGSCAAPPVQIDWSDYAGTFPSSVTAEDGTVVTITLSDPFNVADGTYFGLAFNGTTSLRDNPLLMAMTGANNGDYTRIQFDFSSPVQPCFELLDVDRAGGGWEDTMEMVGTLGGAPVDLGASDFSTGPANAFLTTNTVRGTGSAPNSNTNGNVTVNYPSAVDRIIIEHRDDSTATNFQYIGIHDFRWC